MKKVISMLLSLFVMCVIPLIAFAGSIDVDLVYDDEALVFIGSVDDYIITYEEDDYPNTEYSLTVTPNEKIKGDVEVDKPMNFEKVSIGGLKLQKNTNYLFGYLPQELYIWELESYNDLFDWEKDDYTEKSIILKERHNDTISGGMQQKLNDGSFTRAEKERQNGLNNTFTDKENDDITNNNNIVLIGSIISGIVIMFFAVLYIIKRKKRTNK